MKKKFYEKKDIYIKNYGKNGKNGKIKRSFNWF